MTDAPPVYGLVLAGGRSTRMQRDKAALQYRPGETQLEATMKLLSGRVSHRYLSVRADQRQDPLRARFEQIVDQAEAQGPIAGILSAMAAHPEAAWLVLACDLPFLDANTLDTLLAARVPQADATAFRSTHDGLPEPLCAIYEPRAAAAMREQVKAGRHCPRKFLIQARTHLLDQPEPRALDNVNTVDEYASAMNTLDPAAPTRDIQVQYYALLREQAGCSAERLTTRAATARELYAELAQRHAFTLPPELLRVAINSEFAEWSQPLRAGDAVVFIPPVAGG